MTSATEHDQLRQPTVKRLGLDDGWWFFCPHFLNLGLPLVFVDACLIPDADHLGLEPFGARRPDAPLRPVDLRVGLLGDGVSVYNVDRQASLIAFHWFRSLTLQRNPQPPKRIGIIIGDSYALQLTWSALWTCRIGMAIEKDSELDGVAAKGP